MTKYLFTNKKFYEIKSLLKKRLTEPREEQKKTRARIRKLGFNISDYFNGFSDQDFQGLLDNGEISLVDSPNNKTIVNKNIEKDKNLPQSKDNAKESLPPIVDEETEILVLGTMPGENSLTNQQYYNNPTNQFWKIIFSIFNKGVSIDNYNNKIELLKKYKIGLWDVLKSCERKGSSDSEIKNPEANDFETFFNKYSTVKTIIFNGKDSFTYFKNYTKTNFDKSLIQLNSTSSLNSRRSIGEKIEEWKVYLKKNAK